MTTATVAQKVRALCILEKRRLLGIADTTAYSLQLLAVLRS